MATQELNSAVYQPAGTYIGEALGTASASNNDVRVLALMGKGSRYIHESNTAIVRGFISKEQLAFALATSGDYIDEYVATLQYPSDGKQSTATLISTDIYGTETTIFTDYWNFSSDNAQIVIEAQIYDAQASYSLSYQSASHTVGDPIATANIRKISAVGSGPNQNDYKRSIDYYIDTVVTAPTPALDSDGEVAHQTNATARVTTVTKSNSAGAVLTIVPGTAIYSREYVFTATSTAGGFTYVSTPISTGNAALPKLLAPVVATLTEAGPAVTITDGDVTFTAAIATGTIAIGDTYTFSILGPSLFEVASSLNNDNQFSKASTVSHTGTGSATVAIDASGFTGKLNVIFSLRVSNSAVGGVTFQIATGGDDLSIGDVIGTDVTVLATGATSFTLGLGVTAQLSSSVYTNYVVGDTYSFTIYAPRTFATALDDRTVALTVGVVGQTTDYGYLSVKYNADTYEGGSGNVYATATNKYSFSLPGGIKLLARNTNAMVSTSILNENSHGVGDKWTVVYANNNLIYWTLDKKATESLTSSNLSLDRNGSVTGLNGQYYVVLKHDVSSYVDTLTVRLNGNLLVKNTGWSLVGTDVLVLSTVVAKSDVTTLSVSYTYAGSEPTLGNTYYITADYLRPDSDYNNPQIFYSKKTAQAFVAPYTVDNYLAIALDVAYGQTYTPPAVAVCVIKDSDDDGKFTKTDVQNALDGCAGVSYIKDFVPVGLGDEFTSIISAYNVTAHDPFERREQFWYYGPAAGTAVGSETTEGSLVYISMNTLQVTSGTLAGAHGSRIMVGSTICKIECSLDDGSTVTPTLDGSFVAVALAAMVCGQSNNSTSMLKQKINGFKYIQTYNDTINRKLGGSNIIYFTDQGSNVYEIEEDVTVDTYANHYHEILAMREKQEATRYIRKNMDKELIGYVPDSLTAGVSYITRTILRLLSNLVADGTIAQYQDESGNVRSVSTSDINVYRDDDDDELYHFSYVIYTRSTIKRLYGLYSVNENLFSAAA